MLKKWFGKNEPTDAVENTTNLQVPKHIAMIMDGNGRWAKKRGLPRVAGHKEGMNTVKKVTKIASDLGVKVLTLYAFSTENWKRPKDEVNFLMQLPIDFFDTFVPDLMKNNVKVTTIGNIDELPEKTQQAVKKAKEKTKENTGMILNFALNYGSRDEITQTVQQIAKEVKAGELSWEQVDEACISNHLMTGFLNNLSDPELIIRTSGEERLSNFLLWQSVYSEFYFTSCLWPDFDESIFMEALENYQGRNRRFGGLKEEK
ncbi:isoprenyl transferase [Catellicoccus marimammalium]|uniref:Isoprenyl transferase n=1 Tax=Catellicoccus marimammalium M35/04/3 TaxID=1234409 RepID=K8ZLL9_9ENTE|nr:isoprenyl transferase [Catellicoccus marimammalium]EKU27453.1 Undecaprenyl pyrophosphate synthetase [Catellicoccus marimammalium M35/04/3]